MLALHKFGVQSIIGASYKLEKIIGVGFGDAELAQGCPILRLHDPNNIALFERELGSQTSSQRKHVADVLSERRIRIYNTNLSRVFVRVDMRFPILLRDFVFVFLIDVHFCQAATFEISCLSENLPDIGSGSCS